MKVRTAGILALVVLVAALGGGYSWLRFGYDPGIAVYSTGVVDVDGRPLNDAKLRSGGPLDADPTLVIPYEQDRLIVMHFSLTHDPSIDPTIEEIPVINEHSFHLLVAEEVYVGLPPRGDDSYALDDFEPFHPSRLGPGPGLTILITFRVKNCSANMPGAMTTIDSLPVRYSVFGVTHEAVLQPLQHLAVESPPKKDCLEPDTT